jgi:hypothetical protein
MLLVGYPSSDPFLSCSFHKPLFSSTLHLGKNPSHLCCPSPGSFDCVRILSILGTPHLTSKFHRSQHWHYLPCLQYTITRASTIAISKPEVRSPRCIGSLGTSTSATRLPSLLPAPVLNLIGRASNHRRNAPHLTHIFTPLRLASDISPVQERSRSNLPRIIVTRTLTLNLH